LTLDQGVRVFLAWKGETPGQNTSVGGQVQGKKKRGEGLESLPKGKKTTRKGRLTPSQRGGKNRCTLFAVGKQGFAGDFGKGICSSREGGPKAKKSTHRTEDWGGKGRPAGGLKEGGPERLPRKLGPRSWLRSSWTDKKPVNRPRQCAHWKGQKNLPSGDMWLGLV